MRTMQPLQIVACAHRLSGNALLDLLPAPLVGVEIGRVRWQEEQRDRATESFEVFLNHAGLVNAVIIHHQIDLAPHACSQTAEECADGVRRDRSFMDHETQLAFGGNRRQHLQRKPCAGAWGRVQAERGPARLCAAA